MDKDVIEKLANLGVIANTITQMCNRTDIPKATLHKLLSIRSTFENEFINTLLNSKPATEIEDENLSKRLLEEKQKLTVKKNRKKPEQNEDNKTE